MTSGDPQDGQADCGCNPDTDRLHTQKKPSQNYINGSHTGVGTWRVYVRVCVRERERQCVCVSETVCVCVCVCELLMSLVKRLYRPAVDETTDGLASSRLGHSNKQNS